MRTVATIAVRRPNEIDKYLIDYFETGRCNHDGLISDLRDGDVWLVKVNDDAVDRKGKEDQACDVEIVW